MRRRPATRAAYSVDLLSRLIRHSRGGMMLLARQRSRGSAAFAKAGCTRDLAITKRNRCGGRQPIPTHERDRGGGRNARATSSRLHAFPVFPPAIHPRESPAAAGPAAIIRQAQKTLTFSLHPLSVTTPPPAIKNQRPLVQKLWTKSLPCGNPRKTENDSGASRRVIEKGVPHFSPPLREVGILVHHHNRGCPTLRDFRRACPERSRRSGIPRTSIPLESHRFRRSTSPRSSLCLKKFIAASILPAAFAGGR